MSKPAPHRPARPADVGREELETTRVEKFLAVVLSAFMLVGLLWLYAEPLDRTDDYWSSQRHAYSYSYAPAPAGAEQDPDRSDVGEPRAGDEELAAKRSSAYDVVSRLQSDIETDRQEVEDTREAYRTRLDAGENAASYKATFEAAEKKLAADEAELKDAQAGFDEVDDEGYAALQRLQKADADAYQERVHQTVLLRLALAIGTLVLALGLLRRLHRRGSRYQLVGMAAVGAATVLGLVMAGDYMDLEEVGPIALSGAGTAATLAAFVAYQRWLAKRLPERRVRKGECPFCGYPAHEGAALTDHGHCQGCGRQTSAPCTTCGRPRRVGARHCSSCGASGLTERQPVQQDA